MGLPETENSGEYLKRADYALRRAKIAVTPQEAEEWHAIARECLEIAKALQGPSTDPTRGRGSSPTAAGSESR
jgi:hypothetical protein